MISLLNEQDRVNTKRLLTKKVGKESSNKETYEQILVELHIANEVDSKVGRAECIPALAILNTCPCKQVCINGLR